MYNFEIMSNLTKLEFIALGVLEKKIYIFVISIRLHNNIDTPWLRLMEGSGRANS